MEKPLAILFHCNEKKKCEKFLSDENYLIISYEDGIWLGDGMYFWDNMTNANYWLRVKLRKDKNKEYCIVKAGVYLDHILDLTDIDICNKIEELWKKYLEVNNIEDYLQVELGYKLNVLFSAIGSFTDKYYIIKIIGKYLQNTKNNLFQYDNKNDKIEPITSVKCIYSVRNKKCITDRELV